MYDLKGCLNVSDLNRIEGDIKYLDDNLATMCYYSNTVSRNWDVNGLPDASDISRIIQNVAKLISGYHQISTAPELPDTMLSFEDINALEENLYHIKGILDIMITLFRECNTFECGEE